MDESFSELPVTETWSETNSNQRNSFIQRQQAPVAMGELGEDDRGRFEIELQPVEKKKRGSSGSKASDFRKL